MIKKLILICILFTSPVGTHAQKRNESIHKTLSLKSAYEESVSEEFIRQNRAVASIITGPKKIKKISNPAIEILVD